MSQLRLEPEALVGKERAIEALPTLPPPSPPPLPPTKIREKKSNAEKKFYKNLKKGRGKKKKLRKSILDLLIIPVISPLQTVLESLPRVTLANDHKEQRSGESLPPWGRGLGQ